MNTIQVKTLLSLLIIIFSLPVFLVGQPSAKTLNSPEEQILGIWETPGDDAGRIEIYRSDKGFDGKIIWLKKPTENGKTRVDENNPDLSLRSQPIIGLKVIRGFQYNGNGKWEKATVYDPANGKEYSCQAWLENPNTLKVRGFIGFSLLGRTETWKRVE